MAPLKVFTLGNNGFIAREIADALGFPQHVRQARVLVFAASKRAAHDLLNGLPGCPSVSYADPEFRQATGVDVDAIRGSGYGLGRPMVLVLPMTASYGAPVVEVDDSGPRRIGRLDAGTGYSRVLTLGEA
jgi:hypothetical protein